MIILILIAIVIALVYNCDKHKPQPVIQQNFQSRDVENVDRFFTSMIKLLIDLDQRPDISPSVKLEIDELLDKIKLPT